MKCDDCGKELYLTPVDGQFHVSEQAALDCHKKRRSDANPISDQLPTSSLPSQGGKF